MLSLPKSDVVVQHFQVSKGRYHILYNINRGLINVNMTCVKFLPKLITFVSYHIASYSIDNCELFADKRQGNVNRVETMPSSTDAEPVIGYPVGLAPSMAYYSPEPPFENLSNAPHQQGLSSNYVSFTSTSNGSQNLPQPSQPVGVAPHYASSTQFNPSPYVQAPWSTSVPFMEQRNVRRSRSKIVLALVGGAISGLLLGAIF